MLYTVVGSLFLIVFGIEIAYNVLWLGNDEEWTETEPLEGHPITFNLTGHIVPIVRYQIKSMGKIISFEFNKCLFQQSEMNEYRGNNIESTEESVTQTKSNVQNVFHRRALTFMAFINVGQLKSQLFEYRINNLI